MSFRIGSRILGRDYRPFTVAEVGVNHDGKLDKALEMVRVAARCGVESVKFGVFRADEFCHPDDPLYGTFKRCELPEWAWTIIKAECERAGVIFFATPQNPSDFGVLLNVGVPCVKVGSDDLTNLALIKHYAAKLPTILSIGMADHHDIDRAIEVARVVSGNDPLVLVCTSEYPCPADHANVGRVQTLMRVYGLDVGFSDHTQGSAAAAAASALGACYFEKHFTLDHMSSGPDHAWSADPDELAAWVADIHLARRVMGTGQLEPTPAEVANRDKWRRRSGQQLRGQA